MECLARIRDVPDIRFRLAGYPAFIYYPVPAPVPVEIVPGTGYRNRIVLGHFRFLVEFCSVAILRSWM